MLRCDAKKNYVAMGRCYDAMLKSIVPSPSLLARNAMVLSGHYGRRCTTGVNLRRIWLETNLNPFTVEPRVINRNIKYI